MKCSDFAALQGWCECKSDVNLALGENSKELSSPIALTEASFNDDSKEKTLNVNKVSQQ